jgi:glycosyltransferase involved in cell wall biosynthesis
MWIEDTHRIAGALDVDPAAPLVSVITPAYNVARFIGEAIDSVIAQTRNDFEYLVVDDGSTDDTEQIVRAYAARDARIRLLSGGHRGSSAARNLGIRQARGSYIAFLDGDDRWHPQFLARSVRAMSEAPGHVGAVFCQSRVMNEQGRVYWRRRRRTGDYGLDQMLITDNPTANGSVLCIRRECFQDAGLFDEDLESSVDLEMWLRIAHQARAGTFRSIRPALVDIRVRPGAISRNLTKRMDANDRLLTIWAPRMRPENRAKAYVRPAVMAFRAGDDSRGAQLARSARETALTWLLTDGFGLRMLAWQLLSRPARSRVRASYRLVKRLVIAVILAAAPRRPHW